MHASVCIINHTLTTHTHTHAHTHTHTRTHTHTHTHTHDATHSWLHRILRAAQAGGTIHSYTCGAHGSILNFPPTLMASGHLVLETTFTACACACASVFVNVWGGCHVCVCVCLCLSVSVCVTHAHTHTQVLEATFGALEARLTARQSMSAASRRALHDRLFVVR